MIVKTVGVLRRDRLSETGVALRKYLNERLSSLIDEMIAATTFEDFSRTQGAAREVKRMIKDIEYQPINPAEDTD